MTTIRSDDAQCLFKTSGFANRLIIVEDYANADLIDGENPIIMCNLK
ncbi:MAG: hypothetical protein KA807_15010 [Prolixibacteraceae bacterium]|nr:hypothetical protein [Prolixibacteraceae bacterium]